MGNLDKILFWFFGFICLGGIALFAFSLRNAMKSASRNDEGLRMFFWSVGVLVGLILTAGSLLYFLLPLYIYYFTE